MFRFPAILAAALCAALPAAAQNPIPEGHYIVIDEMLKKSTEEGWIVPVYVSIRSAGDTLAVSFTTTFDADKRSCERMKKCNRTVHALDLDVTETEGALAITDLRYTATSAIDRGTVDVQFILHPARDALNGTTVSIGDDPSIPGMVTLSKPGADDLRLVPGSTDLLTDAIDFAKTSEIALGPLGKCMIRQIAKMSARHDRSLAHNDLLAAVAHAGRFADIQQRSFARNDEDYDSPEALRLRMQNMALRIAGSEFSKDPEALIDPRIRTTAHKQFGEEADAFLSETFDGHEQNIRAFRAWEKALKAERTRLGNDAALGKRLCEDITLKD